MVNKRTSLEKTASPLDELFVKTTPSKAVSIRRTPTDKTVKPRAKMAHRDGFELLDKEIKKKKSVHLRLVKQQQRQLQNIRRMWAQTKTENKRQTSLLMYDYQLDWLEMKKAETQIRGGKPLSKAVLLRALIDLLIESAVDFAGVRTETDIIKRIKEQLGKPAPTA